VSVLEWNNLQPTRSAIYTNPALYNISDSSALLILYLFQPNIIYKMVLDLYNPITQAIHIASKVYKINNNSVKTSLRDDWLDRRFFNGLSHRVIDSTASNNKGDVIKSDSIIPFKDNLISLCNSY
jgi:hypothetical protein